MHICIKHHIIVVEILQSGPKCLDGPWLLTLCHFTHLLRPDRAPPEPQKTLNAGCEVLPVRGKLTLTCMIGRASRWPLGHLLWWTHHRPCALANDKNVIRHTIIITSWAVWSVCCVGRPFKPQRWWRPWGPPALVSDLVEGSLKLVPVVEQRRSEVGRPERHTY